MKSGWRSIVVGAGLADKFPIEPKVDSETRPYATLIVEPDFVWLDAEPHFITAN